MLPVEQDAERVDVGGTPPLPQTDSPRLTPDESGGRAHAALTILALTAFVVGTAEFIVVGVLDVLAEDLRIPVSAAGQLVGAYALGIAIGGPLITAFTTAMDRRTLLLATLATFAAGNIVMTFAADRAWLLGARFVTGSMHGVFVGVASVIATSVVPARHAGRAMSLVFGGVAVATVLGVPLGTFVAQTAGWRAPFVAVVGLSVIALIASWRAVPRLTRDSAPPILQLARAALAPRVLAVLAVGLLLLGGQFTAFTYLVPYLNAVTGVSGARVSAFLLAYGIASAIGMFLGGRFADRHASTTLIAANALLLVTVSSLYVWGSIGAVAAVALALWGLVGFGLIPSLQLRVIRLAGPGGDLAATFGASAINAGVAIGSTVGGLVLTRYGVDAVMLLAAGLCAIALPATWGTKFLREPSSESAPQEVPDLALRGES